MPAEPASPHDHPARQAAHRSLAAAAAETIPGVDFASITVREDDHTLYTAAATDPLALQADGLQYELREGPCYEAVTAVERHHFVVVRDLASAVVFPRYTPQAVDLGVGAQAAFKLADGGHRVGLNVYSRTAGGLDSSIVQVNEFAKRAGVVLDIAEKADELRARTPRARSEDSDSHEAP